MIKKHLLVVFAVLVPCFSTDLHAILPSPYVVQGIGTPLLSITEIPGKASVSHDGRTILIGKSIVGSTAFKGKGFLIQNRGSGPLVLGIPNALPRGFQWHLAPSTQRLLPGQFMPIAIKMDSSSLGRYAALVVLTTNDPQTPFFNLLVKSTVSMTVSPGYEAFAEGKSLFNHATLDFGSVMLGDTIPAKRVDVWNVGDAPLLLSSYNIIPPYSIINAPSSVDPGKSATIVVQMRSDVAGDFISNLKFNMNDPEIPTASWVLKGQVRTAPQKISILQGSETLQSRRSSPVHMGSALQGQTQPLKTFTIKNTGRAPLQISAISVPRGYVLTKPFSGSIQASTTASFSVQMQNEEIGRFSGNVLVSSNDPLIPTFFIPITGEVEPADCPNDGTTGRALVYKYGPMDYVTGQYKGLVDVCTRHLGIYDQGGNLTASNNGLLDGKWGKTELYTLDEYDPDWSTLASVPELYSPTNDFRISPFTGDARKNHLWSAESHYYYWIDDYRTRFLNDQFLNDLHLPPQIDQNLRNLQYRPDLAMNNENISRKKVRMQVLEETYLGGGLELFPIANGMVVPARARGIPNSHVSTQPPFAFAWDGEMTAADYAGLVAFWILNSNKGFPSEAFFGDGDGWKTNVLPAINDGLSSWVAHRYSGQNEVYKWFHYIIRKWDYRACGTQGRMRCEQGENVRNVMMYDIGATTNDGLFPFYWLNDYVDGPLGSDLSALFIGAMFYDIENDAGLGTYKADLLIWKSLSLISNVTTFSMADWGNTIIEAARQLWPDTRPGRQGLSIYEDDIADVLKSRGVPIYGVSDFRTLLPPRIGNAATLDTNAASAFGSQHPESQPSMTYYGNYSFSRNGYTHPDTNASYVAYKLYKYSKYGPCDKLVFTDGTFWADTIQPYEWIYNGDGTYYTELVDRDPGNIVVIVPGRHIKWLRSRQRCPSEQIGHYSEDVRPFGFIAVQAISNGYSFTVKLVTEDSATRTYRTTIVDPSLSTLGGATYTWVVTDYLGNQLSLTGQEVVFTVERNQPFTLAITRSRGGANDTISFRERGNDFDRSNGQAFVRNLMPQ